MRGADQGGTISSVARARMGPTPICANSARAAQHEMFGRTPPRRRARSKIVLDGDQLAASHEYFKFGGARHSPDHSLEAWSADIKGSEYFTIRVRDWRTGADLEDVVEETDGAVVWATDCKSFFYVKLDDKPPARCRSGGIAWEQHRRTMF